MKQISTSPREKSLKTQNIFEFPDGVARSQAMIEFDVNGTILTATSDFLSLVEYSLEEIQSKHHHIFLPDNYEQSSEYKKFWEHLLNGKYQSGEYKRLAKGGREVWIQGVYLPIEDKNGNVIKVLKIATDITSERVLNARNAALVSAVKRSQAVIEFDVEGKIQGANDRFLSLMGYALNEIQGKHHSLFVTPDDVASKDYQEFWQQLKIGNFRSGEFKRVTKEGKEIWIHGVYAPIINSDGQILGITKVASDITERIQLLEDSQNNLELQHKLRNERKLLSQMSEWLFCTQSIDELKTVVSTSMPHLFPNSVGALYIYSNSRDVLEIASSWGNTSSHTQFVAKECWALRKGRAYSYGTSEISLKCEHVEDHDNTYFCLPITAHGDTIGLLHLQFTDTVASFDSADKASSKWEIGINSAEQISLAAANVRLQQELEDMSVKDNLTGLWNRRWFLDKVWKEIKIAATAKTPLCLVSLDVDHFKKFNDSFGHDAGDEVLKEFSSLMRKYFMNNYIPCRVGGEEFIVIAINQTAKEAKKQVEKFSKSLKSLNIIHANRKLPEITVSGGIACLKENETLNELLKRSDSTLYRAKHEGRKRCLIHDDDA